MMDRAKALISIARIMNLTCDVNPEEIATQAEHKNISDWCNSWQLCVTKEINKVLEAIIDER